MEKHTILIVDDEESIRDTLKIVLKSEGYNVFIAKNGERALEYIENSLVDIMITDLKMPKMDGIELMKESLKIDPFLEVIIITAYGDIETAVEAMKIGAFDYIQKVFSKDELILIVKKAIKRKNLINENMLLKEKLGKKNEFKGVIGESPKMRRILSLIDRVSISKATVLLTGESGVGKEVFAKLIHGRSLRKEEEFVIVDCGAIPENLMESELFGHEKGSFTGAIQTKTGKFEQANGGTIFLDEVGELPLSMQVKLLRVLEERKIEKVGSLESLDIDIRIIAATNKDLVREIKKGEFREDLYYRLNVINLEIPPLRERIEDIPLLALNFLDEFSLEYDKRLKLLDMNVLDILINHTWMGNVRELKNAIERSVVVANKNDKVLKEHHLPNEIKKNAINTTKGYNFLKDGLTLKEYEKLIIINTLNKNKGNKTQTAEELGFKRQTLYNKMDEYEIKL